MPGRVFSNGNDYRFSFNGQEKTPEITPNSTTAEFWQYDARISRRWNVDPRPSSNFSPYLVFNANPIIYNDFKGDTSIFRIYLTEGGQSVYDGKYYDGNLHDPSGKIVDLNSIDQNLNSNSIKILNTFNEIRNESTFGKFLIDAVTNHEKNTYFGLTDNETATREDNIVFNFNQSNWIKTTLGKEKVSKNYKAAIVHEFGHLFGNLTGNKKTGKWTEILIDDEGTMKPITYDELVGMAAENIYRKQMGLPLRTHYSTTPDGTPIKNTEIKWDKKDPKVMSSYLINSVINNYYLSNNPVN